MAFDTSEPLAQSDFGDELMPGTTLFHGTYRITRFINSGGFGITYLATDSLGRDVVIKECFSSTFCRRAETRVRARSHGTRDHMSRIVKSFLHEAKSLAGLKHPNIVGVHQVFEDNDTAYMALDYIKGHDLLEIVDEKRADLSPELIVRMAAKLIAAVGYIHDNHLLHCDISPDNIFVTGEGEPILIDFGAARRTAAGAAERYSGLSVVKDGYSPHELYTAGGNSGPWSDLYALAAALYHAISGKAPVNCQSRLAALAEKRPDPCARLAGAVDGYPNGFLEAIDRAMAVMPTARFATAAEWLKALPHSDGRADRKVVLVRRVMPGIADLAPQNLTAKHLAPQNLAPQPMTPAATVPGGSSSAARATAGHAIASIPVQRPRRPTTRVAEVDLSGLRRISGFLGGCLVDALSGHVMAGEAGTEAEETSTRTSVAVARAHVQAMEGLAVCDPVDDIQIALGQRLHLIRPLDGAPRVFVCVALDREAANPHLARVQLRRVAQAVRL